MANNRPLVRVSSSSFLWSDYIKGGELPWQTFAPNSLGRDGRQQDPKLTTMAAKLTRNWKKKIPIAYGLPVES